MTSGRSGWLPSTVPSGTGVVRRVVGTREESSETTAVSVSVSMSASATASVTGIVSETTNECYKNGSANNVVNGFSQNFINIKLD